MSEKKILVKEVCHKASVLSQFDGLIKTSVPIHGIYEIKHVIKNPRVLVGKKVIALIGNILLKVYCVKDKSLEVFLVEKAFNYRSYIPGDYAFHHLKPCTSVTYELQDIIIESIEEEGIRLAGIIKTHLILTLEKEYNLSLFMDYKKHSQEDTVEVGEPISLADSFEYETTQPMEDRLPFEEGVTSNAYHSFEEDSEEVYAEVIQGQNQDLTIILE